MRRIGEIEKMAVLEVLVYPNTALRQEAICVSEFDDKLKKLINDMRETMYAANGVGLAAPQVGIPQKLVVIDWNGNRYVLVNPRIVEQEGEERREEGCLSFPGIYEEVARPEKIRVLYQDENGDEHDETIEGFLARVFAHEIDHLECKLMIDHLSPLKRTFLRKKMERKAKSA
ncbi:peptide deformylase [Synergistaceae bacterium OttesenSCG-928-I11]|nr:peptide deformylase [Synergistaceae bacterium OttesenSCG-928-I11]